MSVHIYIYNPYISLPRNLGSDSLIQRHSLPHPSSSYRELLFCNVHVYNVYEPGSKLLVLGMVIQPLIGNPYNGYINPYYWVDDHPLLYGNNENLDPIAHMAVLWDAKTSCFSVP